MIRELLDELEKEKKISDDLRERLIKSMDSIKDKFVIHKDE